MSGSHLVRVRPTSSSPSTATAPPTRSRWRSRGTTPASRTWLPTSSTRTSTVRGFGAAAELADLPLVCGHGVGPVREGLSVVEVTGAPPDDVAVGKVRREGLGQGDAETMVVETRAVTASRLDVALADDALLVLPRVGSGRVAPAGGVASRDGRWGRGGVTPSTARAFILMLVPSHPLPFPCVRSVHSRR